MPPNETPAREAAQVAIDQVYGCLAEGRSFILEAGAGAGKTYSLINTLEYLIEHSGKELAKQHRKIACITYTNVAKDQINARTDNHPIVYTDTIHAFCWSLIKNFQAVLKAEILTVSDWSNKFAENGIEDISSYDVIYENGYKRITDKEISLHHDDVIVLMIRLLENPKFRARFVDQYPILLIDEYQDTNEDLAAALMRHFVDTESNLLIGLFGDPWQKIYGNGCGQIENVNLQVIQKHSNFRSAPAVVTVLNNIRDELQQEVEHPDMEGSATVFHTNDWQGVRRTDNHWRGDLPSDVAQEYLDQLKGTLQRDHGWDFSSEQTKILMLTHNALADQQGYRDLANVFQYNELFIKKEDRHIAFFADILEPACNAFTAQKFGEMFRIIGGKVPSIKSHSDKVRWSEMMTELNRLRTTGSIGEVLDYLYASNLFPISDRLLKTSQAMVEIDQGRQPAEDESSSVTRLRAMRTLSYMQVIALVNFIEGHTPFATKHSVKGDEFDNVLVVLGGGWNQYNFDQMLSWETSGIPAGREDAYERVRNLFYVSCSRPKRNLALLFTQELSGDALHTVNQWFDQVVSL